MAQQKMILLVQIKKQNFNWQLQCEFGFLIPFHVAHALQNFFEQSRIAPISVADSTRAVLTQSLSVIKNVS